MYFSRVAGLSRKVAVFLAFTLSLSASLTFAQGDEEAGLRSKIEKLRSSGKKSDLGLALYQLGQYLAEKRRFDDALPCLEETLAIDRSIAKPADVFKDISAIAMVYGFKKDFAAAEKFYGECLNIARETGSLKLEALTYSNLGTNAIFAGRYEDARGYFEKSKDCAAKSNDYVLEAQARLNISKILKSEGKLKEAIAEAESALKLLGDNDQESLVGEVNLALAELKELAGDIAGAITAYRKSAAVFLNCGEPLREGKALLNLSNDLLAYGKPNDALAELNKAHEIFDQEEDKHSLALVLSRLGSAYADIGNFAEAQRFHGDSAKLALSLSENSLVFENQFELAYDYYLEGAIDKALKRFLEINSKLSGQTLEDKELPGETLNSIAMCYRELGQYSAASEYYEQAFRKFSSHGNQLKSLAVMNSLACLYLDSGKLDLYQKKFAELENAMKDLGKEQKDSLEFKRLAGYVYFNHAQFLNRFEDSYSKALDEFKIALQDFEDVSDRKGQIRALNGLGLTSLNLAGVANRADKQVNDDKAMQLASNALSYFKKAQPLAVDSGIIDLQWECSYGLGAANQILNNLKDAETYYFKAISLFEKEKAKHTRDDSKTHTLDLRGACFQSLVTLLVKSNRFDDALEIAERGRARAFLDLLEGRKQGLSTVSTSNSEEHLKLTEIGALSKKVGGSDRAVEIVPKVQVVEGDSITSEASAKAPDKAELKQLAIESDSTIVEYYSAGDSIFVFVVEGGQVKTALPLSISSRDLNNLVAKTYDSIISPPQSLTDLQASNERRQRNLQELHKLLISPIEGLLPSEPAKVVTVVPHGALYNVPFAALTDVKGNLFIESHTLAVVPAIGVFRGTHKLAQSLSGKPANMLVFGNPTMRSDLGIPPLPYSEREAKKIAELFGAGAVLKTGADASRTNLRELGPKSEVIHLATHGLIDQDRPMDSSVLLACSTNDDGLFTVRDILKLPPLKARLITLSACQTGRGRITGDGVAGLSRAFLLAGTPSIIVSLWNVDDVMTEFQMSAFYQSFLSGKDKAVALREAQLKTVNFMEKDMKFPPAKDGTKIRANPRYWAAFQLIGEHK